MAKIKTVAQTEQWLKEVNGGYDVCFEEVTVDANAVEGKVWADANGNVCIIAQVRSATSARAMVRGNPSIVGDVGATALQEGLLAKAGILIRK